LDAPSEEQRLLIILTFYYVKKGIISKMLKKANIYGCKSKLLKLITYGVK
jgi:hypothetical protein